MAVSRQPALTPSSDEGQEEEIASRGETKWKRFHPFRVVRKIFRRRIKREGTSVSDASKKSWSTSELQSVQDDGPRKQEVTSPLKIGLSVSHDSIFSPENNTAAVSTEVLNIPHGSSLTVHHSTIKNMFKDELFTRVRARRDSDDDDAGLPHSPCTSPTTVDVLGTVFKEKSSKSRTTCSAGSLISMGSSENDEDSAGHSSGHSSRMSLVDRRSLDSDGDTDSAPPTPLNHNAAHHKIAVRPKRTYGLPRRRMNQIAASKVSTLPSTPELIEDYGKSFQKFSAIEVVKTFTEVSVSSNEISTSLQSSERQQSHMVSSFSCNEVSDSPRESYLQKERYISENNSQILKGSLEDNSKSLNEDIIKRLDIENLMLKGQSGRSHISNASKNYESANKNELNHNADLKSDSYSNQANIVRDSSPVESNNFETTYQLLKETNKLMHDQSKTSLKVTSLVKSLDKSESFKNCENLSKVREEMKSTSYRSDNINSIARTDINVSEDEEVTPTSDMLKKDSEPNRPVVKTELLKTQTSDHIMNNHFSMEQSRDFRKTEASEKLDIDSEFVLKPLKRNIILDSDSELVLKDNPIEIESPSLSSLYFEEESIMSSKSLSLGVEESGVFVSHHASVKTNRENVIVTEAHNFAAVKENPGVFIQAPLDLNLDRIDDDHWVNSVDIPASMKLDNDVTVNSSTSTLCDSKMLDEKITISVNSKSQIDESAIKFNKQDNTKQSVSKTHTSTTKQDNKQHSLKEKTSTKLLQKSHFKETSSNATSMKNMQAQKRVSVEIVPFSQRVKERKYQPISFTNKDSAAEQSKTSSSSEVGRKLSDRKVSSKNKDSDRSNNRHSFSGSLTTENDKEESEKNAPKSEKVQYPVQIRIHKSVPQQELKDNKDHKTTSNKGTAVNEVKFQMQAAKVAHNEIKVLKEVKSIHENTTKWEVKIQPSAANDNNIQEESEICNSPATETNLHIRKNSPKSSQAGIGSNDFQLHQESESSAKSRENSWRATKEVPVTTSDEPEPELLRVFARRSIKQKHCDKGKGEELQENTSDHASLDDSSQNVCETKKESNEVSGSVSKPHITKNELKKKSKSFCEKDRIPRSVSPLKEINLIHGDSLAKLATDSSISSEIKHPRQRLASVPDVQVNLPPDCGKTFQKMPISEASPASPLKEEIVHKITSAAVPILSETTNGSLISISMVKDCQDVMNDKEAHAPSWLQLAQQRRELREQRERLLLGGSSNSFMDGSNKPTRSSKVWDMVNNFQKLQMT